MKNTFNWGIIGPGRIANKFATDLQVVEDAAVNAVASKSGSTDLADKFKVPKVYREYHQIAEDPDLDAIYIALPHNFHADAARICLEAGKPVLIEKPLTVNAAEAEALISLSERNNVFLMEAMWSRFLPVHQQIHRWLEEGLIGEVRSVRASFGFLGDGDLEDRWLNPLLAGGSLLDIGIYPLSMIQYIMGAEPVEVQAQGILSQTGVDEFVSANLKYASGSVAHFFSTFLADTRDDLEILGRDGRITVKRSFYSAEKAVLEVYGQRKKTFKGKIRSGGFEYQIEEAMACIRAGKIESEIMPRVDSLGNMRVMDEIRSQIGVKYPFE